jgi:protocatechuate 3,4-dioxygenase beta subunit
MAPPGQAIAAKSAGAATLRGRPAPTRLNVGVNAAAVARMRMRTSSATHAVGHTGIISGLIRSAAGSPVGGACVTALGRGSRATARTGSDGRYLLGGLRPGQYQIRAGACASALHPSNRPTINASWSAGPAQVTVRAGQIDHPEPISILHLDLTSLAAPAHGALSASASARRGSISGLVTGDGRPLRGVCALAAPLSGNQSEVIVHTSKTGRYRIARLRPGRYEVGFVASYGPCHNVGNWIIQLYPGVNAPFVKGKVKAVRVRAGKDTRGIDGHLKKGGEISGTVRGKSGKALSGICVNVFTTLAGGEGAFFNLVTNKVGEYAARGLWRSGYKVEFSAGCRNKGNYAGQWWPNAASSAHAKTIRITGTRQVGHIDATLLPGAIVSGVVKALNAAGKPLAGVCVSASNQANEFNLFGESTQTDAHGRYRISGLSAGRTTIQFDPSCGGGFSIYEFAQRPITLKTGQKVTGFNVYLQKGGGISGLVTDAHGRPVGGVCVQVNDDVGELTRTRPNGHYSLIGVENGSFGVFFFGGCGNAGSLAPQFYPNSPTSLFAKPIRFKPNTITRNIDAAMQPGGALAGTVTDTAGHRLSGVCVSTLSADFLPTSIDVVDVGTNRGKYLIPNLAPGTYGLSFGCGRYGQEFFPNQVNPESAGLLSVNASATTTVPVTTLSRAGAIAGKVSIKSGTRAPVCVEAAPAQDRNAFFPIGFSYATSYEHGHYQIGGLAAGRYLVQFSNCLTPSPSKLAPQWYRGVSTEAHATSVTVRSGQTTAGISAQMTVGGTITGRVVGPTGKPASRICVTAFSSLAQTGVFGRTGRAGRYRLTGLSTGRWSLTFTPCSSRSDLALVNRPGTVRVAAPHTVTGVDIRLPLGGSVSGRVTSKSGGKPLGGVCVILAPVKAIGGFSFASTDAHGRYEATQLQAGSYRVYIADPSCNEFPDAVPPFAPQWYNGQPRPGTASVVHVSAGGAKTGINAALSPFAAVTGTVQTQAHAPVPGECVIALPFHAAADPATGAPAQPEVAVTDRTGGYTLTALMPGRYKIAFRSRCGASGFATQWWDDAGSAKSAKVLYVGFATITGIDATLRR